MAIDAEERKGYNCKIIKIGFPKELKEVMIEADNVYEAEKKTREHIEYILPRETKDIAWEKSKILCTPLLPTDHEKALSWIKAREEALHPLVERIKK
jgi:hypothetical protein